MAVQLRAQGINVLNPEPVKGLRLLERAVIPLAHLASIPKSVLRPPLYTVRLYCSTCLNIVGEANISEDGFPLLADENHAVTSSLMRNHYRLEARQ